MNMNERVKLILKTKNISASKFADEIGVQKSSISHIISGRNNPSLDFIQKIMKRFPDINSDWLMFGKGTMYKESDLFSNFDEDKTEKIRSDDGQLRTLEEINDNNTTDYIVNQYDELKSSPNDISRTQTEPVKKMKSVSEKPKEIRKIVGEQKATSRRIERIVIFYSDKTCTEYSPE
jgi:transcriptional regulator with XRE-family HTH domain